MANMIVEGIGEYDGRAYVDLDEHPHERQNEVGDIWEYPLDDEDFRGRVVKMPDDTSDIVLEFDEREVVNNG